MSHLVLAHKLRQIGEAPSALAGEADVIQVKKDGTLAFAKIELARVEAVVGRLCRRRTKPETRDQLRLEYSIVRHDIVIYEVRPHWKIPGEEIETPCAKIKFIRSAGEWRLYWMRQDLRWHFYEPFGVSANLEDLVVVIDEDALCCFFG